MKPDCSGLATKFNQKCEDGRVIKPGAFAKDEGKKVPLVWEHNTKSPDNILGYAILKNEEGGVRAYNYFNDTDAGKTAKKLVKHGSIDTMSIRAGNLVEQNLDVLKGTIKEVSLVPVGANPGAKIDELYFEHSDTSEFIISLGSNIELVHSDKPSDSKSEDENEDEKEGEKELTVQEVIDSLTPQQAEVVGAMVEAALYSDPEEDDEDEEDEDEDEEDVTHSGKKGSDMPRNLWDTAKKKVEDAVNQLTPDQVKEIMHSADELGSLKAAVLKHADDQDYGIGEISLLFPDAKALTPEPELIARDTSWVGSVINGANKVPFAKVKSLHADITFEKARALGYIKGSMKKEEYFSLTSRSTGPKTIYKKQKLDRDDLLDITSFDVVVWLKKEMIGMLLEELARAILFGDGRPVEVNGEANPDKIDENHIRPISKDNDFYSHKVTVPSNTNAQNLVKIIIRNRKHYKGKKGNPVFYTTEDVLADLMLLEDRNGRPLYETIDHLARKLRVSAIIPVEAMEDEPDLIGIMVNMADYTIGTNAGGQTTFFDDFDIDFNQHKYLYETRLSGALTRHKTALVFNREDSTSVVPEAPTQSGNTITIPSVTGLVYKNSQTDATVSGNITITADISIYAEALEGYSIPAGSISDWVFVFEG